MCDIVDQEPTSYEEYVHKKEWVEAMMEEYQSIMKNDVWDIVPKPEKKCDMFEMDIQDKHVAYGSIEKYQEIFVARGFSQKEGIDYEETFYPVSIRGNLGSKRGLIRKRAKISFCELEFKNQQNFNKRSQP